MTQHRTLHLRQAMLAGLGVSIFLTVVNTAQAPSETRVASFVLTATACAVMVALVFLVATAVQARRDRG